jgi:hypothetical protein
MNAFDGSTIETTRSFWAAAICWPMFFALGLITGVNEGLGEWLVEPVGFVVGWVAFALASQMMAKLAGREAAWPRFIAAWNWSNIPQYAALVLLSAPGMMLPASFAQALALVAVGYALWLEWFVTKHALGIPGASAVMFVLLDVAIGLFVQGIVGRMTM